MSKKLSIEMWDIEKVIPYPKNAKKHSKTDVAKLARAIKEYGWTSPITVDADGVIIAGHGRRLAAIELGHTKVPVICRTDLTKEQADALRLADNKAVALDYDTDIMQSELMRLTEAGVDLTVAGFDPRELEFMTVELGEFDDTAFVEDIAGSVEDAKGAADEKVAEVDAREVPIAKALGFKTVPGAKERVLNQFMARLEGETGLKGAAALVDFVEKLEA